MNIYSLFELLHPVIDVLGTLTLVLLMSASVLISVYFFLKRFWKLLVGIGIAFFLLFLCSVLLTGLPQ